ncbi:MAG TPA: DUF6316 family protein [Pseudomonadales bacterium]|nr:DUF6316 family protein [Pseudomonadales bacterium]
MPSRAGEPDKMRFRGSHVFPAHGKWYFNTREGIDVGPFETRSDAEINSTRLRLVLAKIDDPELARTVITRYTEIPTENHSDLRSLLMYVAKNMRVEQRTEL